MSNINYVYPNPDLCGEECPVCKEKSWDIFKCECGEVFCKYCKPQNVDHDYESEMITVRCPKCERTQLFI